MQHSVNERKGLLALAFIVLAIFVFAQAKLFSAPVLVSENGLGLLVLSVVLVVIGSVFATKSIRRV